MKNIVFVLILSLWPLISFSNHCQQLRYATNVATKAFVAQQADCRLHIHKVYRLYHNLKISNIYLSKHEQLLLVTCRNFFAKLKEGNFRDANQIFQQKIVPHLYLLHQQKLKELSIKVSAIGPKGVAYLDEITHNLNNQLKSANYRFLNIFGLGSGQSLKNSDKVARNNFNFDCIILVKNNSAELLNSLRSQLQFALENYKNAFEIHQDIEQNIIYFRAASVSDGKEILHTALSHEDITKWFNHDTQEFPFDVYQQTSQNNQSNQVSELKPQLTSRKPTANSAQLNVIFSYYVTDGGISNKLRNAFAPYTQQGISDLQRIQEAVLPTIARIRRICDFARTGLQAHAHHLLAQFELPSMPEELDEFKADSQACINQLKHALYHQKGSLAGQLKKNDEIDINTIALIYHDYLQAMATNGFTLHGRIYTPMSHSTKDELLASSSSLPGKADAAKKDSWYAQIFNNPAKISIDFLTLIHTNGTNSLVEQVHILCSQRDFESAHALVKKYSLDEKFPELKDVEQLLIWKKQNSQRILIMSESALGQESRAQAIQKKFDQQSDSVHQILSQYNTYLQLRESCLLDPIPSTNSQERLRALGEMRENGALFMHLEYQPSERVKALLESFNFDINDYLSCSGNQLQQVIHQECLALLEKIAQLAEDSTLAEYKEALLQMNYAAILFNKQVNYEHALIVCDFMACVIDYSLFIGDGALQGLIDTVEFAKNNPLEIAICSVAGEYLLGYQLAKIAAKIAHIAALELIDPERSHQEWEDFIQPIGHMLTNILEGRVSLKDTMRAGSRIITSHAADAVLFDGFESFYSTLKRRSLKLAKKAPEKFKKAEEIVERSVVTCKNMKIFFTEFEFGKILKGKYKAKNKVFHGKAIYEVTEKIPAYKGLKKGEYFYLDAHHLDHLEVLDGEGNTLRVLNLDGTINEAKSAAAKKQNRHKMRL